MDGKPIIKSSTGWFHDPCFDFIRNHFIDFAVVVRELYINELNPNSIITIKLVYKSIDTSIKAIHDTTTTDEERRYSCGGYVFGHRKMIVNLITLEQKSNSPIGPIIHLPNRIQLYDGEDIHNHIFDYIEYPELILSPSDN